MIEIDITKYTDDELENLSNGIEVELARRSNARYKNFVQGVLNAIYEIDNLDKVAFGNSFDSWTWEELANSIENYNLK